VLTVGYYNDVAIALKKELVVKLAEELAKRAEQFEKIYDREGSLDIIELEGWVTEVFYAEEGNLYYFKNTKWEDSDPLVESFQAVMDADDNSNEEGDGENYYLIYVGDSSYDDVDEHGEWKNHPFVFEYHHELFVGMNQPPERIVYGVRLENCHYLPNGLAEVADMLQSWQKHGMDLNTAIFDVWERADDTIFFVSNQSLTNTEKEAMAEEEDTSWRWW
jgi:hypothetical protein